VIPLVLVRRVLVGDEERVLVFRKNRFRYILGPGEYWIWTAGRSIRLECVDVRKNVAVPQEWLTALNRNRCEIVTFAVVEEGTVGLLYVDGRLEKTLTSGNYGFWNAATKLRIEMVDLRLQTIEVPGQEILTKDKVSVRVNIWTEFQVVDPVLARQSVKDIQTHLYRRLQIAVRQTLARRTLQEVLDQKVDIDEAVAASMRGEMEIFGIRVGAIALKDIVLPGDLCDILNQVVAAEKQAEANLIRRREETAATRSLLNTAKLMESNPLLVRMKELETLEKIAEKVGKITVNGGLDSLLKQLVTMKTENDVK
jgi:regulator of protease activity HflC (stomatin/prohibitin superfamily)